MLIILGVYCYWLVQFNITFTSCWYLHGLLLLTIAGPKKTILERSSGTWVRKDSCLGTVQYFGHLKGLKCCIVPKEPIPETQNTVLSLKIQQINTGEVFKGLALHELVFQGQYTTHCRHLKG